MSARRSIAAPEALERLREGNRRYLDSPASIGDTSARLRESTCREGQSPFAVIVTCSDSRVIPESIFSAGIGELFVVRSAGNVMGEHELGSVEYAVEHLGCQLVVVMGHTSCGAVAAALEGGAEGHVKAITDSIRAAVDGETDPTRASVLNAAHASQVAGAALPVTAVPALYHIDTGAVEFL